MNHTDFKGRLPQVTIHFREDSIPGLRHGELTDESKQAIAALALSYIEELIKEIDELEGTKYLNADHASTREVVRDIRRIILTALNGGGDERSRLPNQLCEEVLL